MAEKTAQERYADVRKSLVEVGQHGIAWQLDQAWLAARNEHAAELAKQAGAFTTAAALVPEPVSPQGEPGEGGGASSQAGVESKEPLPGGVIA